MILKIIETIFVITYFIFNFQFTKKALHMYQQNRYEHARFRNWQLNNVTKTYPLYIMATFFIMLIVSFFVKQVEIRLVIFITIFVLQIVAQANQYRHHHIIKPLVYTNRVKRQIVTYIILYALFMMAVMNQVTSPYPFLFFTFLFSIYQMHIISIIGLINSPIENFFKGRFMKKAQAKLNDNPNLIKIGITGSYGKTSSKNIIDEVLSKKFYCLQTPSSYNTPLGISKTINNDLQPIHEVFLCEMGADKKGDISELFNLVNPNVGVVTSIGEQHLQTFKTLGNIINEKMKMVEMMDEKGLVVLNKDEQYIREYPITSKAHQIWYGIDKDADIVANNIKYSKEGSDFDVTIEGKPYHFKTKLLGKNNIYNILSAIAIGLHYNVNIGELQTAVRGLNYVPNRLEIKKKPDYTIIDNAFNSNPVASKMSLDVLASMPGQRICITPGMIDLGEKQDYYNKEFGKYFKDRCDVVILVGKNQTQAIYEGLEESGFAMKHVHVVDKIFDAFALLNKVKKKDAYVLLENDLPDAFNN
jgi:UDP-N-acetylmuramoyl-tripeptide--D-alanyl-D-alanine ligase